MRELERLRKEMKLIELTDVKKYEELEVENFDKHPDLKRRLKVYVLSEYESDVILDDKHLLLEFELLKKSKNLEVLWREVR
ncbi:hypothetical protein [Polaribacter sp. IC063]|uniref:hypothetical protein n=1 Tax=Polaribacter sp. IC063 TaxID=57031 RepID=UPI0011BE7AF9|nr:hypothetical protein [Polaribacter sp. IC063]TXD53652.1 hypothetical protein ES043_03240 [Polaribacter sp. IC063]